MLFPQVVGFVAFGFAWLTGLAPFVPPPGGFWNALVVASTIGTAVGVISAAGEEIGWRGYMVIRLIDAGVQRPVLVSGVIWGLWHVPLIVVGAIYAEHPARLVAVLVFMVSATAAACVLARARLETGSIWPCIVLHAAYNSVIQGAFWPARPAPRRTSGWEWRPGSSLQSCWSSSHWRSAVVGGPSCARRANRCQHRQAASWGSGDRLPNGGVEPVPDVDRRDRQQQGRELLLVVDVGGVVPHGIGDGVGPVREPGQDSASASAARSASLK